MSARDSLMQCLSFEGGVSAGNHPVVTPTAPPPTDTAHATRQHTLRVLYASVLSPENNLPELLLTTGCGQTLPINNNLATAISTVEFVDSLYRSVVWPHTLSIRINIHY